MCRFDGFFRAVTHAVHTTLALESPERAVVNHFDSFYGTVFNTQATIIAIGRGIIGFGEKETAYKIVAQ